MALDRLTKIDGGGISTTSNYRVGIITASKFIGPFDGTGGNFSGVVTATNGVFSGNISAVDGNFSGNVTIGGTLTYEDVTNIDSVGIITARDGIKVGTGVTILTNGRAEFTGFTTFSGGAHIPFGKGLVIGPNSLYGQIGYLSGFSGLQFQALNQMRFSCWDGNSIEPFLFASGVAGQVDIMGTNMGNNGTKAPLIRVTGHTTQTITMKSSDGTNLTERFKLSQSGFNFTGLSTHTGNFDLDGDIDVDGHTNLDNVSIAGITTVGSNLQLFSSGDSDVNHTSSSNALRLRHNSQTKLSITSSSATFATDVVATGNLTLTSTVTNEVAGPEIKLYRNSSSPADADYLGQIKFAGESDTSVERNYAKITGKILDASNGTEDGILEFAHIKGGSQTITGRWRSDSLQLLNDTNLSVAGDTTLTGDLDVDGHTNLDNVSIVGVTTLSDSLRVGGHAAITGTPHNYNYGRGDQDGGLSIYAAEGAIEVVSTEDSTHGSSLLLRTVNDGAGFVYNSTDNALELKLFTPSGDNFTIHGSGNNISSIDTQLRVVKDGAVELYYNGTKHLETTSTGVSFNDLNLTNVGTIACDSLKGDADDNTNITFAGSDVITFKAGATSPALTINTTQVKVEDDQKITIGTGNDLTLWHNQSHSIIKNTTGRLYVLSDDLWFKNQADNSSLARFLNGDTSIFYFAGNEKLRTSATGATVIGEVAASQDYPNQRPTLDFNFAKTKALDPRLSYVRSGPASYYDDRGLLVLVGDDTPRFDHDPMTRESKGILLEESRRNMQPHSIQYGSNGADGWVNIVSQMYVDYNPGVVTPTGDTIGAITFKDIGGTTQHYLSTDVVTVSSGTTYTFSFFFKSISGSDANNVKITTSGGNLPYEIRSFYFTGADTGLATGDDTTLTQLPNGWWRATYVVTASGNGNAALLFDLHALNSGAPKNNVIAIYGLQCEIGDFPTSYIPTDGNYAIRGGDTLTMTGSDLTDVFNEVEGTMFYEASLESLTRDNQPIAAFRDISSTTSDYHAMGWRIGGSSDSIRTWFRSNSGNEFLSAHSSNGLTTKMFYKHIYGYKLSDCADAYRTATNSGIQATGDGSVTGDGTPMITQGLVDELRFGEYYSLGDTYKLDAGHIKRFSYWTQKLTNTQLTTYIS